MAVRMDERVDARGLSVDGGFTLVELLIVIVILGILATVTVFAVRGIVDQGSAASCATDRKTLEVALEAYSATVPGDAAPTEADLVTSGFLREQSAFYDIAGLDVVPAPGNAAGCS